MSGQSITLRLAPAGVRGRALNQRVNDRTVFVSHAGAKLCLEMLAGPEVMFHQVNKFTAAAQGNPPPKDQWHGVFNAMAKTPEVEFVVLMRVGAECKADGKASAVATRTAGGWRVEVDGRTVSLAGETVTVSGPGAKSS